MERENLIGSTIKVIAWIVFVTGTIAGFVLAVSETFLAAMIVWFAMLVFGSLLLGVSEIIRLLQQQVDK